MSEPRLALSIEELAYALGVMGGEDVASGLFLSVFGERPKEEIEARLLSASHSLVARRMLTLDLETMSKALKLDVQTLLSPLLVNRFSLRCSRTQNGIETIVNYYFGDTIIAYGTLNPVVAEIRQISNINDLLLDALSIYVLSESNIQNDQSIAEVPASLIEELKNKAEQLAREEITTQLKAVGVEEEIANTLAEDLKLDQMRGSIIRIEQHNSAPVATDGFLLLQSSKRSWLFEILTSEPPQLRIWQGSRERFAKSFERILQ